MIFGMILTVVGLVLFETISSIDNAIINAEVLSTMKEKARRWFLIWGILIAVFLVLLFFHWLFLEPKKVGLRRGRWFYCILYYPRLQTIC